MKLTVGDISFSASGPVNVFATVGVEPDQLPFPICTMNVTVPLVEGKALEQYKDELLEVARKRIAKMYKEIVCGGELDEEIIIPLCGKLNEKFNIKVVNKNGKLSVPNLDGGESDQLGCLGGKIEPTELSCKMKVAINDGATDKELEERIAALEKRLGEQTSSDMLKAIHEVSKKAAQEFLNQAELKKKIAHDINGEGSAFYNPDGTVRLQAGGCDEYSVGFSFRMIDTGEKLRVTGPGKNIPPTEKHRDEIVLRVIRELSGVQHINMVNNIFKTLGRCMGYLQVAAEIQAEIEMGYASDKGKCLDDIIKAFDRPPLKNVSSDWIAPGVEYLKKRMSRQ